MKNKNEQTVFLAFCYRFFPLVIFAIPFFVADSRQEWFLFMAIAFLVAAIHDTIGLLLKWDHVYCALQMQSHRAMTPDKINWDDFNFMGRYGKAIISAILSIFAFICYLLKYFNII